MRVLHLTVAQISTSPERAYRGLILTNISIPLFAKTTMLPFFMHGDGFILDEEDLKKYNGHQQIHKYYFADQSAGPKIENVPLDTPLESLKEWLRPTKIKPEDVERWKTTPAIRILMIKTKNEFSRSPAEFVPTHRTIPGFTEVLPHSNRDEHVHQVKELFRHARLPLAAIGAYIKSHITFLSAPSYEVITEGGVNTGKITKYYCSGTSWSIAWSFFHATRHTSAVLFYREGDGADRRSELEHEIIRLKKHIPHPLLLAFIKTNISLVWTFKLLERTNGETYEVEKGVGLTQWDWVLDREIEPSPRNDDDPLFEEKIAKAQKQAVERYNVISGKLINIRFRLRSFREQISWLHRMNKTYLKSLQRDEKFVEREQECQELDTVLDRMEDFCKVYLHDADTLADRLNQQLSLMSFLVNQRETKISLAIGDINNELAWQGRNTNKAMMAIAVASFIFLPSTFIGSVFDAGILHFEPPTEGSIVTQPFWIFWVVCSLTTGLLCLGFWVYVKKAFGKHHRDKARLDFRRRISRMPTLTKRASRSGPEVEDTSIGMSWLSFWKWRVHGRQDDEEARLGIGALEAVSFDDRPKVLTQPASVHHLKRA